METILQVFLYLTIGFVEMFIITARTSLISKGKSVAASSVVFFETLLYFVILNQLVTKMGNNWPVFVAYAMGGSLGTFVNIKGSQKRKSNIQRFRRKLSNWGWFRQKAVYSDAI